MAGPGQIRSFKSFEASKRVLSELPSLKTSLPYETERATRPTEFERGYGYDWSRYRKWYLRHNPFCVTCGRMADLVDHIRPMRYGGSRMDTANHQALCRECHATKSKAEEAVARANGWVPLWGKGVKSPGGIRKKPPRAPLLKN
mgnify:CR=1 FL=1